MEEDQRRSKDNKPGKRGRQDQHKGRRAMCLRKGWLGKKKEKEEKGAKAGKNV